MAMSSPKLLSLGAHNSKNSVNLSSPSTGSSFNQCLLCSHWDTLCTLQPTTSLLETLVKVKHYLAIPLPFPEHMVGSTAGFHLCSTCLAHILQVEQQMDALRTRISTFRDGESVAPEAPVWVKAYRKRKFSESRSSSRIEDESKDTNGAGDVYGPDEVYNLRDDCGMVFPQYVHEETPALPSSPPPEKKKKQVSVLMSEKNGGPILKFKPYGGEPHNESSLLRSVLNQSNIPFSPFDFKSLMCNLCPKKFENSATLKRHITMIHPDRSSKCSRCQGLFATKVNRDLHEQYCNAPYPSEDLSPTEDIIANVSSALPGNHGNSKSKRKSGVNGQPTRSHPCRQCVQSFSSKYELKTHIVMTGHMGGTQGLSAQQ